jgi:hypothetical protein
MLCRTTRKATLMSRFNLMIDDDERLLLTVALAILAANRDTPLDLIPQVRLLLRRLLSLNRQFEQASVSPADGSIEPVNEGTGGGGRSPVPPRRVPRGIEK